MYTYMNIYVYICMYLCINSFSNSRRKGKHRDLNRAPKDGEMQWDSLAARRSRSEWARERGSEGAREGLRAHLFCLWYEKISSFVTCVLLRDLSVCIYMYLFTCLVRLASAADARQYYMMEKEHRNPCLTGCSSPISHQLGPICT